MEILNRSPVQEFSVRIAIFTLGLGTWLTEFAVLGFSLPKMRDSFPIYLRERHTKFSGYFFPAPFAITPQAMRSPELPAGSVRLSSAVA